jgi:peptide-methionine (R)-S-oxide reductase
MATPNNAEKYQVEKTEEQWKAELDPERYAVLREAATERAWTGELLDESRAGLYTCAACNAELFRSGTKFDSGCGWPSFYDSVNPDAVELIDDGFGTPTGLRYCMNSLSLGFTTEPVAT